MTSQPAEPVDPGFALGSLDAARYLAMSGWFVFRRALLILPALALACHEPSNGRGSDCDARPVRMGVASSLREATHTLQSELALRAPAIEVEAIFGASSVLARQVALGAPLDLFVSADAEIVDDLTRRGLLTPGASVEFARGRLDLLARADWHAPDAGLAALDDEDLARIAIPAPAVPLGRYARTWLAARGLLAELEGRIVSTEHARATLSAVDAGLVDLAFVYDSDARLARRAVVLARLDPARHPPIRYVAARIAAAPECESIDASLAAWTEPAIQARLGELGFLPAVAAEALP